MSDALKSNLEDYDYNSVLSPKYMFAVQKTRFKLYSSKQERGGGVTR